MVTANKSSTGAQEKAQTVMVKPEPESDAESDPEFVNNTPYVYENKKKGKGKARGKGKGKQREEVIVRTKRDGKDRAMTRRSMDNSQTRASAYMSSPPRNVLLSLFGSVLQRSPESTDDEPNMSSVTENDDDSNDHDTGNASQSTSANSISRRTRALRVNPLDSHHKTPELMSDGSVTESDTEAEDMFAAMEEGGGLRTKPDGEAYLRSKSRLLRSAESDTETEPDDDSDVDDQFNLQPRPQFPSDSRESFCSLPLVDTKKIQVPSSINGFLRDYQREGVRFFWDRYKEGKGGVLGDDMGLGKTIQVISFLSAAMEKYGDVRDKNRRRKHVSRLQDGDEWRLNGKLPPANSKWPTCLVIAPSSVVYNWQREFDTWGYFELGMYTGPPEMRAPVLRDFTLGRLDVLVTSFETARSDIELLCDLPWSMIFVDEAHRIKNPLSKLTSAFSSFTCEVRFGLTGTAIQNNYEELWTLLNWSNPGRVGTSGEWKKCISKPLAIGQSAKASEGERALAKAVANILVNKILPLFFLRRTKDLIRHQLPKKIDEVVFCPLTAEQTVVYKRILAHREVRIKANGGSLTVDSTPCDCGSGSTRTRCCHVMEAPHFFTYLTILLKISNHLALILPSPDDTEEQLKRNREVANIAFRGGVIPKYGPSILKSKYCGKWDVLNQLLAEWRKDRSNKVLLFTKSVKLLQMLDYHLQLHSYPFCRLDGSTKPGDRMDLIDMFNNSPEKYVFLISTLAGGTGLNLTAANKVVIFDPNWNPAHDLQAMDRAYRFGQTRDVNVYRLLGAGSVEELIYARQVYKQQMMKIGYEASHQTRYFEGVQGDAKRRGELFGAENLFKLHENTLATKMAIEKAHLAEFDWTLAHMAVNSKNSRAGHSNTEKDVLEAEARHHTSEEGDLRGLASLLLDDDAPSVEMNETVNEINQILSAGTVKYVHQNDDLLRPSRVEEESLRDSLEKFRKRKATAGTSQSGERQPRRQRTDVEPKAEPEEEWPPKRRHQIVPLSPRTKLRVRQRALVEMGMVRDAGELPSFAAKFGSMSQKEQEEMISKLDEHYAKNRQTSN